MLPRTSRLRAAAATFAIGAAVTIGVAYAADAASHEQADLWLTERAGLVARAAAGALADATGDIEALAALVEAADHTTAASFADLADRIDIHPGVLAFAHIPIVPSDEVDAFVEEMQAEQPDYELTELATPDLIDVGSRHEYYPIMHVIPGPSVDLAFAANPDMSIEDLFGFDLGSDSQWMETLERSRRTNTLAVSDLIQADPTVPGKWILFFTPIRDDRGTITGFIGGASVDLLLAASQAGLDAKVNWQLQSVRDPIGPEWQWTDEIALGPGRFRLAVAPIDATHSGLTGPALYVVAGGIFITLLVVATAEQWRRRRDGSRRIEDLQRSAADKDRFLASLSHEIRTPLTVVAGFAHELIRDPGGIPAAEQEELLRIITSQSDEVVNLLEELLVAARGDIWEVSIHAEAVDVRREMERAALIAEGTSLMIGPGEPRAFADPRRVRQIIRNLLGNAVRYGGPTIAVEFCEADESVSVTVSDDGPPIPAEEQASMFEAYAGGSGRHTVGSIGLGLFVSRGLARRMGGDLGYSHDGSASRFELSLPRHLEGAGGREHPAGRDRVSAT